jgi:hypothetical protein
LRKLGRWRKIQPATLLDHHHFQQAVIQPCHGGNAQPAAKIAAIGHAQAEEITADDFAIRQRQLHAPWPVTQQGKQDGQIKRHAGRQPARQAAHLLHNGRADAQRGDIAKPDHPLAVIIRQAQPPQVDTAHPLAGNQLLQLLQRIIHPQRTHKIIAGAKRQRAHRHPFACSSICPHHAIDHLVNGAIAAHRIR